MNKVLELGKGHKLEDAPFIEQEVEKEYPDGEVVREKISVPRTYEVEERHETTQELAARTAAHEELRKTEYIRKRQAAYPAVGEGLDAFYKFIDATSEDTSNWPEATLEWYEKCKAVKKAIPKE